MSVELSEFLEAFSIPLHHKQPKSRFKPWIFWSQHECNSSSADLGAPMFHEKIIYVLSKFSDFVQFWAPETIDGRRVLSTSGQPFMVQSLCKEYVRYRLYSSEYKYNIDDNEGDDMIIRGGPATAFLTRLPSLNPLEWIPSEDCRIKLNLSIMIPMCFSSQSESDCIGVLEITLNIWSYDLGYLVLQMVAALKEADMNVCNAQELIPYKTISGLEHAKYQIKEALEVVCASHNIALAQVWIAYEDKNNVLFLSSLVDTKTKPLLALKLTGYNYAVTENEYNDFNTYYEISDLFPLGTFYARKFALKTLQDYESCYISTNAFAICLRSNDTGHLDFVFEFIWIKRSYPNISLEALLLTLQRCLPSFKIASGVELGDEIQVIDVKPSSNYLFAINSPETDDETEKFKVFKGKTSSPPREALEEGKKRKVADIERSEMKCKTTEIFLSREDIEMQFGKTMKQAAKTLDVSESTLKRKLKKLGIRKWPGPNFAKRKANDSSSIQINTNGEDNGSIQEPPNVNINENTLTIKAEYMDDMIIFRLPTLQPSFVTVEKKIGTRFKLSLGTYKLKYKDEDGDHILISSDEEMRYCIESSRKLNSNKVRLLVLPSTQPIPGSGFYRMSST